MTDITMEVQIYNIKTFHRLHIYSLKLAQAHPKQVDTVVFMLATGCVEPPTAVAKQQATKGDETIASYPDPFTPCASVCHI